MTTIFVSISNATVTVNGEHCNFYEAGLYDTDENNSAVNLTDKKEIKGILQDQYDGQEIEVVFEDKAEVNTQAENIYFTIEVSIKTATNSGWDFSEYITENQSEDETYEEAKERIENEENIVVKLEGSKGNVSATFAYIAENGELCGAGDAGEFDLILENIIEWIENDNAIEIEDQSNAGYNAFGETIEVPTFDIVELRKFTVTSDAETVNSTFYIHQIDMNDMLFVEKTCDASDEIMFSVNGSEVTVGFKNGGFIAYENDKALAQRIYENRQKLEIYQ